MKKCRNGVKMKKDWVEEVGEKQIGGAGRLLVCLSPVNVNLVVYLGYPMGVVYRVVHGVVRRVVRGVEVSG